MIVAAKSAVDPRRYFEGVPTGSDRPAHDPICLYLETTNRCNLLCTTCPRTYEELEATSRELAAFLLHCRSNSEPRASGFAWRRRTDAGEEFAAHGGAPTFCSIPMVPFSTRRMVVR
jgi:hypothetical protein